MWYDDTFDTSVNDLYHHSMSQDYKEARTCAVILLWLKAAQTLAVVDCVMEMTAKKSCKYAKMGHLVILSYCKNSEII